MQFVVLNYGMNIDCWDEGEEIGQMVEKYQDTDPKKYAKFLKTSLNKRWYTSFNEHDGDWPHPNKILIGISNISADVQIDWMPEINYLGVYADDDKIMNFLKDNFAYMLNTEASA